MRHAIAAVPALMAAALSLPAGATDLPHLLAASWETDSIVRFDPNSGQYLGVFATGGGLEKPVGLAFGPDRNLYVTSWGGSMVLRYNGQTGAFMDTFIPTGSGGLNLPSDIIFRGESVFILSQYDAIVHRFNAHTGAFEGVFATIDGAVSPAMTFAPSGDFFMTDWYREEVQRFNGVTGQPLGRAAWSNGIPMGVAVDQGGYVFVAEWMTGTTFPSGILKFGPSGQWMGRIFSNYTGQGPHCLRWGPDGNLWTADSSMVYIIDPDTGAAIDYLFAPGTHDFMDLAWMPEACRPDLTGAAIPTAVGYGQPNGVLDNNDFFYYLAQFAAGNAAVADMTTGAVAGQPGYGVPNGAITNDDFFYYLAIFAAGC